MRGEQAETYLSVTVLQGQLENQLENICGINPVVVYSTLTVKTTLICSEPPPHLAADAEGLQRVQAEPAAVSCLFEAVHELRVQRPLEGGQTHQDHMFLFGRQLVLQDVVTSSGPKMRGL